MALEMIISYPETIPDALQATKEQFEHEALTAMAVKLFEMKRLSSGMAASLLGISRKDFLFLLRDYGVAAIDLSVDELKKDLENA